METQTASTRPKADSGGHPVFPFRNPMEEKPTLRQVFETEESPLLRFAYGLVGQRETAEDLVQDAFLKLHAHWDDVANPRPPRWTSRGPSAAPCSASAAACRSMANELKLKRASGGFAWLAVLLCLLTGAMAAIRLRRDSGKADAPKNT